MSIPGASRTTGRAMNGYTARLSRDPREAPPARSPRAATEPAAHPSPAVQSADRRHATSSSYFGKCLVPRCAHATQEPTPPPRPGTRLAGNRLVCARVGGPARSGPGPTPGQPAASRRQRCMRRPRTPRCGGDCGAQRLRARPARIQACGTGNPGKRPGGTAGRGRCARGHVWRAPGGGRLVVRIMYIMSNTMYPPHRPDPGASGATRAGPLPGRTKAGTSPAFVPFPGQP